MLTFGILFILLLIMVIIFAALAASTKAVKGDEKMVKKVYVYLVLFATLMMVIGGSVSAFMAIGDLVAPAPYYQSFEEFSTWRTEKPALDSTVTSEKYTPQEIEAMYEAMVKSEADRQKGRAYNTLFKSFGWIIIPLPVFIYFQRKIPHND